EERRWSPGPSVVNDGFASAALLGAALLPLGAVTSRQRYANVSGSAHAVPPSASVAGLPPSRLPAGFTPSRFGLSSSCTCVPSCTAEPACTAEVGPSAV